MDIFDVRRQLQTKQIFDLPLRVTFYARVSTNKDEQINSLDNQISYYKEYIKSNTNWKYVNGYIDEGLSGMSTAKRENFNRMIDDARSKKFDYIITKEISRFARNTVDSLQFTRELLSYGVAVFFQNDGINTIDTDSELRLGIMSSIAQDELRKLSSRIRFGHSQSIKNGVVLGNSKIFGYKKDQGKLIIDEEQSVFVKKLFETYANSECSLNQLEKLFWEDGFRNTKGKLFSHSTMANIIRNPKYKGYYCGGKVQIVDMFSKQQKFLDESEWTMYKDETGLIVPAIVSEDVWERANKKLNLRSNIVKTKNTTLKCDNLYTGILYCKEHNVPFYKKQNYRHNLKRKYDPFWNCSYKIKNGAKSCATIPIYENELNSILTKLLKELSPDLNMILDKYLTIYKNSGKNSNYQKDLQKLTKDIDSINCKKEKLLDLSIDGRLSNNEFQNRNDLFNIDIKNIQNKIDTLNTQISSEKDVVGKINNLKGNIKSLINNDNFKFNKTVINSLVSRIYVSMQNNNILLEFFLNTGNNIEIEYDKLSGNFVCRSGYTFKKICPQQHTEFNRQSRTNIEHKNDVNYDYAVLI